MEINTIKELKKMGLINEFEYEIYSEAIRSSQSLEGVHFALRMGLFEKETLEKVKREKVKNGTYNGIIYGYDVYSFIRKALEGLKSGSLGVLTLESMYSAINEPEPNKKKAILSKPFDDYNGLLKILLEIWRDNED